MVASAASLCKVVYRSTAARFSRIFVVNGASECKRDMSWRYCVMRVIVCCGGSGTERPRSQGSESVRRCILAQAPGMTKITP